MESLMNWKQRINRAMKSGGRFTREDKDLAADWLTCPVGDHGRTPTEDYLGFMFYDAVKCDCPQWAFKLHQKIKRRKRCNT